MTRKPNPTSLWYTPYSVAFFLLFVLVVCLMITR